jgi:hypothetical protein
MFIKLLYHLFRIFLKKLTYFYRNDFNRINDGLVHEKLVIMLTGPSLLPDLELVKDKNEIDFLAVNHVADMPVFKSVKPKYYLIQDNYFWEENITRFFWSKREKTIKNLNHVVNWKLILILPGSSKLSGIQFRFSKNPMITVRFYDDVYLPRYPHTNENRSEFNWAERFALKKKKIFVPPYNVYSSALYLSYFMDYSTVLVAGSLFDYWKNIEIGLNGDLEITTKYSNNSETRKVYNDKAGKVPGLLSFKLMNYALALQLIEALSSFLKDEEVKLIVLNKKSFVNFED